MDDHERPKAFSEERYRACVSARRARRERATDIRERKRRVLQIIGSLQHNPELRTPLSRRANAKRERAVNALFVIAGPDLWEELSWVKPELFIEWVDNLKHYTQQQGYESDE